VHKGFSDAHDLWAALNEYENWEERSVIVHARIATSGKVNASNCHPYPITSDMKSLKAWDSYNVKMAIAHNGFIAWGKEEELENHSDTMLFVRDIVSKVADLSQEAFENILLCTARSNSCKFATINKDGIKIYGDGWIEDSGCLYSNTSYIPKKRKEISDWCLYCGSTMYWDNTEGWVCPYCNAAREKQLPSTKRCKACGDIILEWEGKEYCATCGEVGREETCIWCGNVIDENAVYINDLAFCKDCLNSDAEEISHLFEFEGGK